MNMLRSSASQVADTAPERQLPADRIWKGLEKASFAVLAYVTPTGKPRASGVLYAVEGRRLYVVTVPIRRGGLLSLLAPIPPATVSFHARVTVHPAASVSIDSMSKKLASLLPPERRDGCLLDLVPVGHFLTYGVAVSLLEMGKPALARAHAPVS